MKLIIDDLPADLFNLIMHGEFYRATEKDYTQLMRIFNSCVIVKQEPKPEAPPYNPSGDLISRSELLKHSYGGDYDGCGGFTKEYVYVKDINNAPTVEVRPQGEWIKHSVYKDVLICSKCNHGSNQVHDTFNFCPYCGAEMRKGGTE